MIFSLCEIDLAFLELLIHPVLVTLLIKKGVNIFDIKQLDGHSCNETTELYKHTITEDLREAVN